MDRSQRKQLESARDLLSAVLDTSKKYDALTFDAVGLARRLCDKIDSPNRLLPEFPGVSAPWRVLLSLFVAEYDGAKVAVTDLALLSGAAPTTSLRILSFLTDRQLIQRVADLDDKRRTWLVMTDLGRGEVAEVLKEFAGRLSFSPASKAAKVAGTVG